MYTKIAGFNGGTGADQIASQTLASTTQTEFVTGAGDIAVLRPPLSTGIRGVQTPFDPSLNPASTVRTGAAGGSQYFTVSPYLDNGRPFLVRLAGLATPASDGSNALQLFLHLGATKSATAIAQTADTTQATTTVAKPFIVEAQLIWASGPRTVFGQFWWKLEGTSSTDYVTWAELTANGSAVDEDDLIFCASAQWGAAAGGVVAVSEFSITRM